MFGLGKDVPPKVKAAKLGKWYDSLTDQDRVKLRRYLDFADDRSAASFITTVIMAAIDDHNYKFAAKVADTVADVKMDKVQAYDVNEAVVLAFFNTERYDECLERCDAGLAMVKEPEVAKAVRSRTADGSYPETLNCRNYKINVIVGVRKDYDAAPAILDQFVADGLITEEEAAYRKESVKTYKLQRTFDGIFSIVSNKEQ